MKKIFFMMVAALVAANMCAEEITVSKSVSALCKNVENGTQKAVLYADGVLTVSVNEVGNNGKVYSDGAEWRVYQSNNAVITVSVKDGTIKTVSFEYTTKNTGTLLFNNQKLASGSNATVNAASAQFPVGNTKSATNGQVKVTAFTVVYEGVAGTDTIGDDEDYSVGYEYEPFEKTTINTTFKGMAFEDYSDLVGSVSFLFTDNEEADYYTAGEWAELEYLTASFDADKGLPKGEYQITNTEEEGTFYASPGGDEVYDYPCYYAKALDAESYDPYYLVSGTVKVTDTGWEVNATSYYGSTIHWTYTYPAGQAVENTAVKTNATKSIKNGMLVIEKNNYRYNVLGQRIR